MLIFLFDLLLDLYLHFNDAFALLQSLLQKLHSCFIVILALKIDALFLSQ